MIRRRTKVKRVWVSITLQMTPLCWFRHNGPSVGHKPACGGKREHMRNPGVRQLRRARGLYLECPDCQRLLLAALSRWKDEERELFDNP